MSPAKKAGFRKIGDEGVRARTGRGWEGWFAIRDAWGAPEKGHTLSTRYLREQYALDAWWSQAVTIRYEWERGLRK